MPTRFLQNFLRYFLVFLVHTSLAAPRPAKCFPIARNHDIVNLEVTFPIAADCLHIASIITPPRLHPDPSTLARAEALYLTSHHGPLAINRFEFPAYFRHRSCGAFIKTQFSATQSRRFTRQGAAFYLWDELKAAVHEIAHVCLQGAVNVGGASFLFGNDIATWDMNDSLMAYVILFPGELIQNPTDGARVYNV